MFARGGANLSARSAPPMNSNTPTTLDKSCCKNPAASVASLKGFSLAFSDLSASTRVELAVATEEGHVHWRC
eukprot:1634592-Amphidinium_carterae.1